MLAALRATHVSRDTYSARHASGGTPFQVVNGPRYQLTLHGAGYKPRLHLSFMSYDFGPVHVWRPGMATSVAWLHARNDDTQPVSFELLWGDKEHLTVRRSTRLR